MVTPKVLLLAGSSIGLDCHRVPEIESKTTLQFNSSVSWWFTDSTNTEKEIASWNTNQNNVTIINNTGINVSTGIDDDESKHPDFWSPLIGRSCRRSVSLSIYGRPTVSLDLIHFCETALFHPNNN